MTTTTKEPIYKQNLNIILIINKYILVDLKEQEEEEKKRKRKKERINNTFNFQILFKTEFTE